MDWRKFGRRGVFYLLEGNNIKFSLFSNKTLRIKKLPQEETREAVQTMLNLIALNVVEGVTHCGYYCSMQLYLAVT